MASLQSPAIESKHTHLNFGAPQFPELYAYHHHSSAYSEMSSHCAFIPLKHIAINPIIYFLSTLYWWDSLSICDLTVCNLLDIRRKISMWVSMYDPVVTNLGIDKCLNQYHYPWIIHCTFPFFLYPCNYLLCTLCYSSYIDCNIVVKDFPKTWPR